MKKRTAIISLLAAAVLTLNAIPALATDGQGQVSPLDQLTQQQSQMESMGLPSGYNPASEEDNGYTAASGAYNANGERVYAGATPIPIDPIDMPTPTPRPEPPGLPPHHGGVYRRQAGLHLQVRRGLHGG